MNKSGTAGQVIARPQGGGAIKGIGDTFSPDLHTGTGNLTVPIALPPGRNGLQPELSLVYSTGHGNGPFGLGWALSLPGVARDTRRGFPEYVDEADAFLLGGAEELVPAGIAPDGAARYRPRTEGLFARITHRFSEHEDCWEVRSRSGLVSLYGHPGARSADPAVVHDPDDAGRIFAWHLTSTTDTFGNRIEYLYEQEAGSEEGPHRWSHSYLRTIRYVDHGPRDAPAFLVTVDFVYEPRPDPFSSRRAGFEIRTTRRCTAIEVRTHAGAERLTRIHRLVYQDRLDPAAAPANGVSLLRRIEVEGVDGDAREPLPPLDFGYSGFDPSRRVYQPLAAPGEAVPERSLAHPDFELADLFGRGLPDVVQIGEVNRYWRNLGGGRFDPPRPLEALPPGVRLGDRGAQLADADGDGHIDLLLSRPALGGYVALTAARAGDVRPFVTYGAAPSFALDDPEVRLVDLDGDGVADALRTGAAFELFYHDRALGWTRSETRARGDLDRFPDVRFSDPRVKLADMSGDGSQDVVLVGEGRVDYWPYLGHGRWGRRIAMRGRIEVPDARAYGGLGFDPKRLLLGDVDGDGVADLVYVESGRVTIWLNRSGNAWSEPIVVHGTPPVADADAVRLADMLGHGSDGILWSYDARAFADSTYKYLDLCGGTKPYLLVERNNNTGARTRVEYAPSTRFYVEDDRDPATRWRRRLPFPVQVVARVEVLDELSGGKLSTEYRYHQGYWDGEEREFRGFGMVEQLDTESFERYHAEGLHGAAPFAAVERVHFSPPVLTRTWFHQGEVQEEDGVRRESEAGATTWAGDPGMLPAELRAALAGVARAAALAGDPVRLRHALRALQGSVLRSELYALDGSDREDRPYTVTETLHDVREVQPGAAGRPGVFFPFQIASRTTQWERGDDPMTRFAFTGGYDAYGLPRTQLAVAVPRGRDPLASDAAAREPYLSTWTVTEYARRDDAARYVVDRTARTTSHEVVNDGRESVLGLRDVVAGGAAELRVIGHARSFYDGAAFVGLPLGQIGDWGVVARSEELAFTDGFLDALYDAGDPLAVGPRPCYLQPDGPVSWTADYPAEFRAMLPPLAGYVHYGEGEVAGSPGGYYVVSARYGYDVQEAPGGGRGLQRETRDPLGAGTRVEYDAYDLLPVRVVDALGLSTEASYDYRTLQAARITDPNGAVARFAYSPASFLTAQYVAGSNGEGDRDRPSVRTEYDLWSFALRGQPVRVRTIRRVHHDTDADVPADRRDATLETVEYSDGLGRLIQLRRQADDVRFGDPAFGGAVLPVDQSLPATEIVGRRRPPSEPVAVAVDGWQVYDNKGRVVERYEPVFESGWEFVAPTDTPSRDRTVMYYDPLGRLVRTRLPDGAEQRVVHGIPQALDEPSEFSPTPWEGYAYDPNDNAGRTHPETAGDYRSHWNTPSSVVVDALGRTVVSVVRNGPDPTTDWYTTSSRWDVDGNLRSVTDPLGRTAFDYRFDLCRRRWRATSLDGGRRDAVPDASGNPVESRDAKGALTLVACDLAHRTSRVWARDGGRGAVTLRQRIEYGDGGAPEQPSAARAAARAHNLLGLVVRHYDEAGLVTIDGCDFKGNVLESRRRIIADAPILSVYQDAASAAWQVSAFQVDWQAADAQELADREAALLDATEYATSTAYDALGRVTERVLPRDQEARRRSLRVGYGDAGRPQTITLDGVPYVRHVAYDARGRRTLIAYGNGVMTRHAYEPHGSRLKRMRSERFDPSGEATFVPHGPPLQDLLYDYDLTGNVLAIRDRTPGTGIPGNPQALGAGDAALMQALAAGDALVRRFAYDPLHRLVRAEGRECDLPPDDAPWLDAPRCADLTRARGYVETYRYDAIGNVTRLEHVHAQGRFVRQFDLDAGSNRLARLTRGQSAFAYEYDPNGNVVAEASSRRFEWSHADRLKTYRTQTAGAEPSVHAHYLYDAGGRRVKKLVRKQGGRTETTHYVDEAFEHHHWVHGTQSGACDYVQVGDDGCVARVRIGAPPPGDLTPAVQFHLADHLGSCVAVLDDGGAFVDREEFSPYGETTFGSYARKRFRYTGKERDEESGLSFHDARYYAPALARWISCDPLGAAAAMTLYGYAWGNPMRFRDPTGEQPVGGGTELARMDTSGDGRLDAQELIAGTSCMTDAGRRRFIGNLWPSRLTESGRKAADILVPPAPVRSEESLARSRRSDYGLNEYGNVTPSSEETDKLVDERTHPSRRIKRNTITMAKLGVTLWQPELVAGFGIAKGIYHRDPAAVFGSSIDLLLAGLARFAGPRVTNVGNRAKTLHEAAGFAPGFADRNVTVALTTAEDRTLIAAGPTKGLTDGQRLQMNVGEEEVLMNRDDWIGSKKWGAAVPREARIHPDLRVMVHAALEGLTPVELCSSLPFCDSCRAMIEAFGGRTVSPYKAVFH